MQLLMRKRNIPRWSPARQAALRLQLRRLSNISPYLLVLVLPGSILVLPLVWWLDRRRSRNRAGAQSSERS